MKFLKLFYKSIGKKPFKLTIKVNNFCNSHCKTCNVWKKKKTKELSIKNYEKIINKLKNNITWISLVGGEPFLRKDITELINYLYKELKNLIYVDISTNGWNPKLIYHKINKILTSNKKIHVSLGISIDGPKKINDFIRGKQGSFDKAIQTYNLIKTIKKNNFSQHINYTLSNLNVGEFSRFLTEMKKNNISIQNINVGFQHKGFFYEDFSKTNYDSRKILDETRNIMRKKIFSFGIINPKEVFNIYFLWRIKNYLRGSKIKDCQAGTKSLFVDYNGKIKPCIQWNKNIGDIKKGNIKKVDTKNCPGCWTFCEVSTNSI
ncbi:radical SAM protein [Candidatus Woesearchaeota archaeon]|nr:radical SAM protein [Candidatus Woesearchaeota archaeon]